MKKIYIKKINLKIIKIPQKKHMVSYVLLKMKVEN